MPVCTSLSRAVGIVVLPGVCAIIDHSQSGKGTDLLFSLQALRRIPVTESQYSFYRMSWVNQKSEYMTETNFCCWWDSNSQPLYQQLSVISLDHHHCSMTQCFLLTFKLLPVNQFHLYTKQPKICSTNNKLWCCELMLLTEKQNHSWKC